MFLDLEQHKKVKAHQLYDDLEAVMDTPYSDKKLHSVIHKINRNTKMRDRKSTKQTNLIGASWFNVKRSQSVA